MRTLVRIVLSAATAFLLASIVWFPNEINGFDFLLYGGLWIVGIWAYREASRTR